MVNSKHFVDSEFPPSLRALVPAALRAAYGAVQTLYDTDDLFRVVSAQIGKGHVIGWAVDYQFLRLIETGKLPFDYRWTPFKRPTGRYLQLRLGASTMSINQLPEPSAMPRHACFRENRALSNAPFLDLPEFEDERRIAGLPHLILGHGYQNLWFAQIGLPSPQIRRDGWIYRTPNLMTALHLVETEGPKVEATDAEAVVTLREELARWARDNIDRDDA
jgi:hypothetical protein